MAKKARRSVNVAEETEVFHFAEVGFGKRHPDLAVIHGVSAVEGEQREHWFALSRTMLAELGRRFVVNAQNNSASAKDLH